MTGSVRELPEDFVADVLESLGIDYQQRGDELWALCPLHPLTVGREDRKPSWSINARLGVHSCFSCGAKGNLYTLVKALGGDQDAHSLVESLRFSSSYVPEDWEVDDDIRIARPVEDPIKTFQESSLALFDDPPQEHLDSRLLDRASVEAFGIRWDTESEAWVLPYRNPYGGALIGYQLKYTGAKRFMNVPKGLKISTTLFGFHKAVSDVPDMVVLVESPLDAVRLNRLGFTALALCGSRVSEDQMRLLGQFPFVLLALDDDPAGRKETDRLERMLLGFKCMTADFHGYGKDFGEMDDDQVLSILMEWVRSDGLE